MNDPHVVSLHYRVTHADRVRYDVSRFLHETDLFAVEITADEATFTMKEHFAFEAEARAVVQPFADSWVVLSGLDTTPR